jgi:putative lipoic acid-binding regulatory protein
VNIQRIWIVFILLFVFLLAGCTGTGGMGDMDWSEEKKIKEKAIQYIKDTYNKDFKVSDVSKDRFTGQTYTVRGNVKDQKNTQVSVIMEQNEIRDTYVETLWTEELKPKITSLVQKHFDERKIEHIAYSNGPKKDKYTGEIPSVFEVLKNGVDPEYKLNVTLRVYEQNGQYEQGIKNFLKELKRLNFNQVGVTIFVADDELKSAPKEAEESQYTLYRYNIHFEDIQNIDIDHHDLNQYKTVIKE